MNLFHRLNQLPSWVLENGKEHDETTESTSGPIGGQSCTTFAVESCLSFQVNRSGVVDDSRQQPVGEHNTRDSLRNLYVASFCSFSEECYLFLLSPFELFGLFFFSFIFALRLLSHSYFLVLCHKKAATLYFLFLTIQAPACTQVYLHPWFPVSVLHASLSC